MELRDALDLLDWKRRVFALYGQVRAEPDPRAAWRHWRDTRDELFAQHCSYRPGWVCPLAPAANTLDRPVRAGERTRR